MDTNEDNGGTLITGIGNKKKGKGFASMDPEKQREIASKGGRAAHMKGTAHEWNSEEAKKAGKKGGTVSRGGRGRLIEGSAEQLKQEYDAEKIAEISRMKE